MRSMTKLRRRDALLVWDAQRPCRARAPHLPSDTDTRGPLGMGGRASVVRCS